MKRSGKIDLYKLHSAEYASPKQPVLLQTSPARYLAVEGRGEPAGTEFTAKISALYSVAFTVKMASKFAGQDYAVCKLEAQWWGKKKQRADFWSEPRETWNWKLIIRVPDFIKGVQVETAIRKLVSAGKPAEVRQVRLESIDEGRCVQALHVGPYNEEQRTIQAMAEAAAGEGLSIAGLHHEIYLSDPRRVPAERLRTILRCPVR